jgi:hypothetical protein
VSLALIGLLLAALALTVYAARRNATLALRHKESQAALVRALHELQATLPNLAMTVDNNPPFDLLATFPRQAGLNFDITVEMDGDEVHLTVGPHLVLELWTHDHPERIAEAIDDIRGLLDGTYRVVVYRQWETVVGTELQAPKAPGWEVVGGWWEGSASTVRRDQLSPQVLQNQTSRQSAGDEL